MNVVQTMFTKTIDKKVSDGWNINYSIEQFYKGNIDVLIIKNKIRITKSIVLIINIKNPYPKTPL